jgi:hypothetical protein
MPSKLISEELQPRPLCQERGGESIVRWCRRYVGMVRPKNRGGVVTLSGVRRSRRAVAYEEILGAGMDKPSRSKVRALPIALREKGCEAQYFDLVWRFPPRDVAHLPSRSARQSQQRRIRDKGCGRSSRPDGEPKETLVPAGLLSRFMMCSRRLVDW